VGLLFILVMVAVTLVPTLRSYLRQQSEIAALSEQVAAQSRSIEGLKAEQARWSDPAYVEQQARERLKFVKVGDRAYTVIDAGTTDPVQRAEAPVVAAASVSPHAPWYGQLWQSVQIADRPSAGMKAKAPAGQGP
jgi:cell division protein FtsB